MVLLGFSLRGNKNEIPFSTTTEKLVKNLIQTVTIIEFSPMHLKREVLREQHREIQDDVLSSFYFLETCIMKVAYLQNKSNLVFRFTLFIPRSTIILTLP